MFIGFNNYFHLYDFGGILVEFLCFSVYEIPDFVIDLKMAAGNVQNQCGTLSSAVQVKVKPSIAPSGLHNLMGTATRKPCNTSFYLQLYLTEAMM